MIIHSVINSYSLSTRCSLLSIRSLLPTCYILFSTYLNTLLAFAIVYPSSINFITLFPKSYEYAASIFPSLLIFSITSPFSDALTSFLFYSGVSNMYIFRLVKN